MSTLKIFTRIVPAVVNISIIMLVLHTYFKEGIRLVLFSKSVNFMIVMIMIISLDTARAISGLRMR